MRRAPARTCTRRGLGSARVSRVGDGVLAIADFSERAKSTASSEFIERLFRRDAETNTRDACATQNLPPRDSKARITVSKDTGSCQIIAIQKIVTSFQRFSLLLQSAYEKRWKLSSERSQQSEDRGK